MPASVADFSAAAIGASDGSATVTAPLGGSVELEDSAGESSVAALRPEFSASTTISK